MGEGEGKGMGVDMGERHEDKLIGFPYSALCLDKCPGNAEYQGYTSRVRVRVRVCVALMEQSADDVMRFPSFKQREARPSVCPSKTPVHFPAVIASMRVEG